jgi:hypothetical protein
MPPVAESEVRFIFELNMFQSAEERSPVVATPAVPIESETLGQTVAPVPFMTMSSGVEEVIFPNVRAFCLLLNMFQSVDESAPLCTPEARAREISCPESESPLPIPIVTASWACAWRASISEARDATTHEREARDHERFAILTFVVARLPERVFIFIVLVATCPESVAISVVFCITVPERLSRVDVRFATVPERLERFPESVLTVVERDVISPESVSISAEFVATIPESVFTLVEIVRRLPERVSTVVERFERVVFVVASPHESVAISILWSATVPESVSREFESVRRFPESILIWFWRLIILPESALWARASVK